MIERARQLVRGLPSSPKVRALFGIDTRALAVFRVAMAGMILVDLIGRSRYLTAHYSDDGIIPRSVALGESAIQNYSLYTLNGSVGWAAFLFIVTGVFAVLLALGYRTRLMTLACWALLMSLQKRNPFIMNSGDQLMCLLMFWSLFLPLGARASVDRHRASASYQPPRTICTVASFAILMQLIAVYVFTAILKDHPFWHTDGTAVYYALSLDQLTTRFGRWLLNYPDLLHWMSIGTYYFERYGPLLPFVPIGTKYFRTVAVFLFIGFHAGLAMAMQLALFSYLCIFAWLLFLPSEFWDAIEPRSVSARFRRAWATLTARVAQLHCARCRRSAPSQPGWHLSRPESVVVALLVAYVFWWNICTLSPDRQMPRSFRPIATVLAIGQHWAMFSPYPLRADGWYVAPTRLRDGSEIDLRTGLTDVMWHKPEDMFAQSYGSGRWRKFLENIWQDAHRNKVVYYANWLRRTWNKQNPESRHVQSMRLFFCREYTMPDYQPPVFSRHLVYSWHGIGTDQIIPYSQSEREFQGAQNR